MIYKRVFEDVDEGFINAEERTIVISIGMDTINIITEFYLMYLES